MALHLPQHVNHDSPQIKLLIYWNQGWKEKNVEHIGKCMDKDFQRIVYPRSIGAPALDKEACLKEFAGVQSFATGFEVGCTIATQPPFA
jgi:hypothetical protein